MKKAFVLLALLALPFVAPSADAEPLQPLSPVQTAAVISVSPWIGIGCMYKPTTEFPGVFVQNTTAATIPKGTSVRFTYGDTTKTAALAAELKPNDYDRIWSGSLPNNTTCKASFHAGEPDIIVKGVQWTSPTTASVELLNGNPWLPTSPFAVRVGSYNCVQVPVKSVDSSSLTLGKNEVKTVSVTIAKDGATYLKALADFDNKVKESNEGNNEGTSSDFQKCVPK